MTQIQEPPAGTATAARPELEAEPELEPEFHMPPWSMIYGVIALVIAIAVVGASVFALYAEFS